MWKRIAIAAALLAGTAAAYLPSIDGEFLLDDLDLLRDPLVLDPLGRPVGAWLASGRPLVLATFALNHAAVGLDPRGWHLTNLAIHLAAAALAFLLARHTLARAGLARPAGPALAAAALFALHPLQVEAVSYVAQRAESLSSGLYLAALLLLVLRDDAAGPRRAGLLAGAALLQAAALLAKPVAATLPAAWLLHAALLPGPVEAADPPWRRVSRRLPAALPLLALSLAAALHGISAAAGSLHAGYSVPGLPAADYLATQLRVIPTYLRLLLLPVGQCGDWLVLVSRSFLEPAALAGGLFLVALAVGAAWLALAVGAARLDAAGADHAEGAAAARAGGFGLLFFLLALSPSSSVVPLRDPLAEHRVYLASLGIFLAAGAGGAALVRRLAGPRAPVAGAAVAAALLAALGGLTAQRAAVWTTPLTFWSDAARQASGKARVHLNLGFALYRAGRPADALAAFRRAAPLAGDGTISPPVLFANLVSTLLTLGRPDEARGEVRRALDASPGDPALLSALAQVEFVSGRFAEAEGAARLALARDPRQPGALKYLGMASLRRGDLPTALSAFRAAAALGVLDPQLLADLGHAEERAGNRAGACAAYARSAGVAGDAWAAAEARQALARLGCRDR